MLIRDARPSDLPEIKRLVAAAFDKSDGTMVGLLDDLIASGAVRASLVAVDGTRIVGHVQLNRGWIDSRAELVEVLVLSPLSVAPDRQGKGVGTHLIRAALAAADQAAAPAVFLEGGWDYYGSRGFQAATPLGFTRPSPRIPERAFQVALLSSYDESMTGPLVYPEAFWAHDCVGLRDPFLAEVEARA